MDNVTILGMRVNSFINTRLDGGPSRPQKFEDQKYEIVYMDANGEIGLIKGHTSHGMCGSGYQTAKYGVLEYKSTDNIGSLHYVPIVNPIIELSTRRTVSTIENDLFTYSEYGLDSYYPSGEFKIYFENWKATNRLPRKPMTHIFKGQSAAGKSTLASLLETKKVIESDAFDSIDAFILEITSIGNLDECVIVLGNKHYISEGDYNLLIVDTLAKNWTVVEVEFNIASKVIG
tara:strand:- start:10 stop:705 length:696 start_codon:yes stop_codon:yes gene_type:complete